MSNQVESQNTEIAAASVEKTPSTKANSALAELIGNLVVTAIMAFVIAVGVVHFAPQFLPQKEVAAQHKFVVLNIEGLTREQILALGEKVQSGEIDVEDMPKKSSRFGVALMDMLKDYAQQNVVVLRADTVVMAPEDFEDITEKVRSDLIKSGAMQISSKKQGQ
jgi:hypothetical protein